MQRIIFHIDMNAYFASVHEAVNPSLKNKPIAIAGENRRGIVSTCSYEARKYGIHSAMPTYQAKELCKDLIIIHPDFNLYEKYTYMFLQIIKRYSKTIEVFSIDECFVDLTGVAKDFDEAIKTAKKIQYQILNELDLRCSIGVSYCKYLAKMASDMKKPLGITLLDETNLRQLMWPMDVGQAFGIGKKSAVRLKELGFNTIGDIATCNDFELLKKAFGNSYMSFRNYLNGIDYSPVLTEFDDAKSVGHSRTFEENVDDYDTLVAKLQELTKMVSNRAKDHYLVGKTIRITLKEPDFKTITREKSIGESTNDYNTMWRIVLELFDKNYKGNKLRLVGVALANTVKIDENVQQLSIYDMEEKHNHVELSKTRQLINELNKELGNKAFKTAREIK